MTRRIFIGNIDGNGDGCADRIKRTSEDRLHFSIIEAERLVEYGLATKADKDSILLYVPYLCQYQGMALFVESTFTPEFDVDLYFNHKVMNNLGPALYFVQQNAWLLDCSDPSLQHLTPSLLNEEDISKIKSELTITTIDKI